MQYAILYSLYTTNNGVLAFRRYERIQSHAPAWHQGSSHVIQLPNARASLDSRRPAVRHVNDRSGHSMRTVQYRIPSRTKFQALRSVLTLDPVDSTGLNLKNNANTTSVLQHH